MKQRVNYLQDSIEDFMAENKQLRDLAGVPANYGVDREAVKLLDREKIDDFKKLIRVLQEDNYRLEAERARLKRDLRQAAMTYTWRDKKEGKALSNEHQQRVDDFVARLLRGEAAEPADVYGLRKENEELKRQVTALNDKGFDRIKGQLEGLIKGMQPTGGTGGFTPEQFAKI
jgi:regulator of replication initiation timing